MQVAILGPVEVRNDDGHVVDVAGTRLRCVLARLAVDAGRPVAAATLIDHVWGAAPPADAANALQTLVSRLRRVLGPDVTISATQAGYQLDLPVEHVDAHRFRDRTADGLSAARGGDPATAARLLADALALWRGPVTPDAGPAAVTALTDLRLTALVERIDAELVLGDAPQGLPELEALAAEHPLDERLAARLVRSLAAGGRQAEALTTYAQLQARLADELGVDPSPELQAAHVDVLRGEYDRPALPRRPRTNLKAQLTSFVGREQDVARITKSLEENRLVTLVGPGGAGKTRLASEAAAGIVDTTPDGVWLVELASVTDPTDVPQAVLAALGLREMYLLEQRSRAAASDATDRLVDALAGRRLLLLLDNCEHLVEGSAALADDLLAHCAGLRILTTSREPLGITGETLIAVAPLGQPEPHAPAAEALEYPAVRLFADRTDAVQPDFAVTDGNVGLVIEIVRRLDGLPLAIELAAARARTLPLDELAARLSDRFRLLTGGSRTALPRHRTLRAVVEWSWDLLTPAERALAGRLAVFASGATIETATAVCADDTVPAEDVLDALSSLVDKSLLQVSGQGRYRTLETIREYGTERLAELGELGRLRTAHARYFADLVREADKHLRSAEQVPWIRRLEAERDNVIAALRYLADSGEANAVLELAVGIGWYWLLTGAHSESNLWLGHALQVAGGDEDLRLLVESMYAIGIASGSSSTDAAVVAAGMERLSDLRSRLVQADVTRYPLLALMRAVIVLFVDVASDVETDDFAELLVDAERSTDPWVRATALAFRVNLAENVGDIDGMRAAVDAALREYTEIGDRWGLASCLMARALINTGDGDLDEAFANYERARSLVRELGAHDDEAWLHLRLADIHIRRGDLAAAVESVECARVLSEGSGSQREAMLGSAMLAEIRRRQGDVVQARRLIRRVVDWIDATPSTHPLQAHGLAVTLAIAAKHALLDGDRGVADERLARAFTAALGTRDLPIVAAVGVTTALVAAEDGRPAEAAERLGAAARLRGTADATSADIADLSARLQSELGRDGFAEAYRRGRALTVEAARDRLDPAYVRRK